VSEAHLTIAIGDEVTIVAGVYWNCVDVGATLNVAAVLEEAVARVVEEVEHDTDRRMEGVEVGCDLAPP
jgi:hypothetical protein